MKRVLLDISAVADCAVKRGIELSAEEIGIALSGKGKRLTLKRGGNFAVESDSATVEITYSERSEIYRGVALFASAGGGEFKASFTRRCKELSLMADCSRNGVLSVQAVKGLARVLARLGYNQLQLYTEDTFEVENEPYFGHIRGRYSAEEIQLLDSYCGMFGIELVPCVQTLAHLGAIFKNPAYSAVNDCADILLADGERTYKLIENIFASLQKNFTSRKVNIGMDEAFLLGAGKYQLTRGYILSFCTFYYQFVFSH
jgi:hypothetical protein